MERYRGLLVGVLTLAIVGGGTVLWIKRPQPAPIEIVTPVPSATPVPRSSPTPTPLRVYVSGAVYHPDVYLLPPQSIVKDALAAAGGATDEADLERINLAMELYDQQQVHVPRRGEAAPAATSPGGAAPSSPFAAGPININRATIEELDALPGVGPAIAGRIVSYREAYGAFATIEEIMNVQGIGPATFEEIKGMIAVQ
ncbi:MAG: helix-hairpin-helix domain-containing protein [Anaerolineae bacterium]|jgi:competence protein ComEA